jgi:hypothetical protein
LIDPRSGGPQPATSSQPAPGQRIGAKRAALMKQDDLGMGNLLAVNKHRR